MTTAEPVKLNAFAAVFTVADVPASLDFYLGRLGFREQFRLGDPPEYAIVDRGAVSIHLMPTGWAPGAEPEARGRSSIYVFARRVDALCDEFRDKGCPIETPPADFPYGMREFSIRDPDGNRITFGEEVGKGK